MSKRNRSSLHSFGGDPAKRPSFERTVLDPFLTAAVGTTPSTPPSSDPHKHQGGSGWFVAYEKPAASKQNLLAPKPKSYW